MRPALCAGLMTAVIAAPALAQDAPTWSEVGAIFAEHCTLCHSGEGAPLGLRLDTLEHALAGSENGPVLRPEAPGESELIRRLKGESEPRMPLTGPPFLADDQIALIERWIAAGMPDGDAPAAPADTPDGDAPAAPAGTPDGDAPAAPPAASEPARPAPGEPVTFAHVEPIFLKRCAKCHKEDGLLGAPPEGLRLDSHARILAGGERLAVIPGNPGLSEVVRRIEGSADPRMPLDGPPWLPEEDIALIRQWIEQGAPDAEGAAAPVPAGGRVRYRGTLTGRSEIDGAAFTTDAGTRIDKSPRVGDRVEVRGRVRPDGTVRATRLRRR